MTAAVSQEGRYTAEDEWVGMDAQGTVTQKGGRDRK